MKTPCFSRQNTSFHSPVLLSDIGNNLFCFRSLLLDGQCYLSSELDISELLCASVSKRRLAHNLFYENYLIWHENEPVGETFFVSGFASRIVLTQRQKGTRKWPILAFQLLLRIEYHCLSHLEVWHLPSPLPEGLTQPLAYVLLKK